MSFQEWADDNIEIESYRLKQSRILITKMSLLFWKITDGRLRLSREGEWDYEPLPSNRSREYIEKHLFTLDEAKKILHEVDGR